MCNYVYTLVGLSGALVLLFGAGALAQGNGGCSGTGMRPYDYSQALCMSFWFYEAQRSGYLPASNRVDWRGDSALDDGSDNGVDLEGGYYDAGDFVKFGFPLSFFVTTLSWGLIEYSSGYRAAGQTEYGRDTIKRATDYLFKCHTGNMELYGQVGDGDLDNNNWGRPEDMDMARPSYKITKQQPGSDLAGETAAALAAASIVFEKTDASYSSQLLDFAREMLDFADQHRDTYVNSIPAGDFYNSFSGYGDELAWGAAWLYKATGEQAYLDQADAFVNEFSILDNQNINFYWDEKTSGIYALMAELSTDTKYMNRLTDFLDAMLIYPPYTTQGMVFVTNWGSIRHAMGLAFIALRGAALGIEPNTYENWAQTQLAYALGSTGHSFIVGFGENPPTHAHHRAASCEDPPAPCDFTDMNKLDPNPHVLFGGLVGGPTDQQDTWQDNRSNWEMTEVGLDYNSCYSGILARMIELNY